MKILITGAAGFIGYHLTNKLIKTKHKIFGIDNFNNYYSVKLKKDRVKDLINQKENLFFIKMIFVIKNLLIKSLKRINLIL